MLQVIRGNRSAGWMVSLILLIVVSRGAGVAQNAASTGGKGPSGGDAQPAAPAAPSDGISHLPKVKAEQLQPTTVEPPALLQQAPGVSDQPGGATASELDQSSKESIVFKAEVQEVLLRATVIDDQHRPVTSLDQNAFQIFEDGKPQRIVSFRREDVPVALAIVIDNSASMRDKRPSVNAAALTLVRASNPQDQVCVINFNNEYYLDQDLTSDVALLQDALGNIESRGGTALYDALMETSEHLMKSAKLEKKVILVVTDGEDTASHSTLEQAVRAIAVDGGPTVYGIGIMGRGKEKEARSALRILSEQTGGVAFFPEDVSELEAISQKIAHDIRIQYTIAYNPSTPKLEGGYRHLVVKASANGYKGLSVRTRGGYFTTAEKTPAASQ